jgi:hypothetical protein
MEKDAKVRNQGGDDEDAVAKEEKAGEYAVARGEEAGEVAMARGEGEDEDQEVNVVDKWLKYMGCCGLTGIAYK